MSEAATDKSEDTDTGGDRDGNGSNGALIDVLTQIDLTQYTAVFDENDIDDGMLADLSSDDLKEIGVVSLGHRKKLLAAFGALAAEVPETSSADAGRAERREVTALFADITGYTSLSRELETEDLHAVLTRFYELFNAIVGRMGGTVDRHIGDCVLAVFGAPQSHGNDTERALRAATEMHRAMEELSDQFGRSLSVHIGAASGKVLFSSRGYGERADRDFTLTGDTVNLASRLADTARPGETLIDEGLARSLAHRIDCEGPEDISVKGIKQPMAVYRFRGFRSTRSGGPMVGRARELAVIRDALSGGRDTGSSSSVVIVGDAGMGKTRLVEEATSHARETGYRVHKALVLDFGLGERQRPLASLAASLCGFGETPELSAIRIFIDRCREAGDMHETTGTMLTQMLGAPLSRTDAAVVDGMDDAAIADARRTALRWLLRRAVRYGPQLLVIEDIHWADADLFNQISVIVAEAEELPVTLILTSRYDEVERLDGLFGPEAATQRLDLEPLVEEDAMAFAQAAQQPSAEVLARCVAQAQGNPLFLEQLLRHAREGGAGQIPGSIQSLVQARVDRLKPRDRRILEAAAILGQRFRMEPVLAIANMDVYDEQTLLEANLIRREGGSYLFEHALIRDAIIATVLRDDLKALHVAAAEWFDGEDETLRAEHLEAARDPRAASAYLAAGQGARKAYRKDAALALAERGLALEATSVVRGALLCLKGEMLRDLGRCAESIAAYEEAETLAGNVESRCRARLGIVAAMRIQDRIDEAYEMLDRLEAEAGPAEIDRELSEIHYFRGCFHFPRGNLEGCLEEHGKAFEHAKRADLPWHQARALSGLGDAHYAGGRMVTAHGVIKHCLALCEEHGFGSIESSNRFMLATVLIYMNRTEEALAEAVRSADLAAKVGNVRPEIVSRLTAGWVLISMARFEEARREVETGLELAARIGAGRFEPFLEESLARIQLHCGDPKAAAKTAEAALAKVHKMGIETFIGPWVMSTVALTTSDATRRNAVLDKGLALLDSGCIGHNHFRFLRYGMEALSTAGEHDRACALADRLEKYTAGEPLPWSDFYIERTRRIADADRGNPDPVALRQLRQRAQNDGLQISISRIDHYL